MHRRLRRCDRTETMCARKLANSRRAKTCPASLWRTCRRRRRCGRCDRTARMQARRETGTTDIIDSLARFCCAVVVVGDTLTHNFETGLFYTERSGNGQPMMVYIISKLILALRHSHTKAHMCDFHRNAMCYVYRLVTICSDSCTNIRANIWIITVGVGVIHTTN